MLLALLALYVLMRGGESAPGREVLVDRARDSAPERDREALDDIDAKSREAMRELLRDAGD